MKAPPDILVRSRGEGGLLGTIAVSAVVHGVVVAIVLLAPERFLRTPPPLVSYSVDLVSPAELGGSNPDPGPAPPVEAREKARRAAEPPPPAPEEPAEETEPAEAPPPEPQKPAAPQAVVKLADSAQKKEAPRPEPEQPQEPEPKKPEPKQPEPKKPEPEPEPKKPDPPKPQRQSETKPNPKPVENKPPAKPEARPEAPVESEAEKRDRAILAAVERRARQVQRSAPGSSTGSGSGALSEGPGDGSGGVVHGVEFLLYRQQMIARIKAAWAWAGSGTGLETVLRFKLGERGEVREVRIVEPSGDPGYDASVERAVRAASPFGPPPERYRDAFVDGVEVTFRPGDLES